eukprot:6201437-Pleurochrysis_carterae.AAC.1
MRASSWASVTRLRNSQQAEALTPPQTVSAKSVHRTSGTFQDNFSETLHCRSLHPARMSMPNRVTQVGLSA